jgi:sugar phosphate permease
MYLMKNHAFSDYLTASTVSFMDIGYVFGGFMIGYLTDLTYSRRTPVLVVAIIIAGFMHVGLVIVNP